jgi:hypothetical protein
LDSYRHYVRGTVDGIPLSPLLTCYFNAALWCKYGLLTGEDVLVYVNALGMGCALVALFSYYKYATDRHWVEGVLWRALLLFAAFNYAVYIGWIEADGVGRMAAIFGIMVYALPFILALIGRSRRFSALSPPVNTFLYSALGVVSCGLWALYGWELGDWWIIAPNLAGLLFSLLQLFMHVMLKRRFKYEGPVK